jgi:hypothetical protein
MDLTSAICKDVMPIQGNQFSLELMHKPKHEGDEQLYYIAAVYICKLFAPVEISKYVETL